MYTSSAIFGFSEYSRNDKAGATDTDAYIRNFREAGNIANSSSSFHVIRKGVVKLCRRGEE
jgi:hypothetical protein